MCAAPLPRGQTEWDGRDGTDGASLAAAAAANSSRRSSKQQRAILPGIDSVETQAPVLLDYSSHPLSII